MIEVVGSKPRGKVLIFGSDEGAMRRFIELYKDLFVTYAESTCKSSKKEAAKYDTCYNGFDGWYVRFQIYNDDWDYICKHNNLKREHYCHWRYCHD